LKKKDYKDVHEKCTQLLKGGSAIGIFPEGTRNKNPNYLLKGRQGIGAIAIKSAVAVLPVGIDFPYRIKNNRIPRFGRIILRIGKKLNFDYEINTAHQINQNNDIALHYRKRWISYLYSKVTYTIMLELSRLSQKMYPYGPPKIPKDMQKYFFALQKGG
jgi:1-acyl-sn-glycerol-3-phosphate acyltransferase